MKNSIAFHLALSSIKKDKRNHLLSFIIMIISFTFVMTFIFFVNTDKSIRDENKRLKYGDWNLCLENLDDVEIEFLSQDHLVGAVGVIDRLYDNHYIGNFNEEFFKIASIELLEGRLPLKDDEIVAIGNEVGSMVKINDRNYRVVGVINQYNKEWSGPSFDYFTINHPTSRNFVYYSSDKDVQTYIKGYRSNVIYNYGMLDGYYKLGSSSVQYDNHLEMTYQKEQMTSILNYFIIIVGCALFISISYNVRDREEAVLLLRCIGMSKADMKKYIYYEMILISLIALVISLIISALIALFISMYYFSQYRFFIYISSLSEVIKYVSFIMIIIICITGLCLQKISINAMDSLVHRVQRRKLYKYSKAKYMNIKNIAYRLDKRRMSLVMTIVAFMIVQFVIVSNMGEVLNRDRAYNQSINYQYNLNFVDEKLVNNIKDNIVDVTYNHYPMKSKFYWEHDDSRLNNIFIYNNPKVYENDLIKGRLPKDKDEGLLILYEDIETNLLNRDISIIYETDKLHEYVSDGETYFDIIYEPYTHIKIVGVVRGVYSDDYNKDYFNQSYGNAIAVNESLFNKADLEHSMVMTTKDDMFFELNDYCVMNNQRIMYTFVEGYSFDSYLSITKELFMLSAMFSMSIVFMYAVMNMLLSKINKDIKLMRCLGMTFKQTMGTYGFVALRMWLLFNMLVIAYLYIKHMYMQMLPHEVTYALLAFGFIFIHIMIFMYMAYRNTHNTVTYYPSEVERYY